LVSWNPCSYNRASLGRITFRGLPTYNPESAYEHPEAIEHGYYGEDDDYDEIDFDECAESALGGQCYICRYELVKTCASAIDKGECQNCNLHEKCKIGRRNNDGRQE